MGTLFSFLKKKDPKLSDDKKSNIRSINSSSSSIDRRRAAEISDFYGGGVDRRRAAEISDFYGGGVDRRRAAEISDFYVRGVDRRRAATDKSAFYGGVDRRRAATEKPAFYERGVTSMANEQSAKEKSAFYVGEGVTSMSNQQSVTTKPDYSAEKKLSTSHHKQPKYGFIPDNFKTLEEVTSALRKEGLESSNLIVGIDFTKSNEWTGKNSFNNRSLHAIGDTPNPYEKAISIIGKTLAPFDDDNLIPCFGFGDATTHDKEVFSFHNDQSSCHGFEEVLACYKRIVPNLRLAGPTSFAPAVEAAMDIVEKTGGQYHVLVIIADGQVTRSVNTDDGELSPQEKKTIESIVNASSYPLSIILIGVGDGPWDDMRKFDDKIPAREFDNFQFVNFTEIMNKNMTSSEKEASFALAALMEIPFQYKAAVELGILGRVTGRAKKIVPRPPPIAYTNRAPIREASSLSTTMVDERREMVCPICLTNGKDLAFGCGHMTCRDCGSRISLCPICRVPINNRLRIFTG